MVNGVSLLPEIAFALKYITHTGNLLAAMNGLTNGLAGLANAMTFQKAKAIHQRSTRLCEHITNVLTSSPFITAQNWHEHVTKSSATEDLHLPSDMSNGLILRNFKGMLPSKRTTNLQPLSFCLPTGSSIILRATSGAGKTMTLLGLLHVLDNLGDEFIIVNQQAVNIHDLPSPKLISKYITFISE